jgi:hypothetical protein
VRDGAKLEMQRRKVWSPELTLCRQLDAALGGACGEVTVDLGEERTAAARLQVVVGRVLDRMTGGDDARLARHPGELAQPKR